MGSVSTSYKRLFLRCVKIDAGNRTLSIEEVLNESAVAQITATSTGVTLVSVSSNGQSYNLLPNGGDGLTPTACAEMIEEMQTRLENAKARLATGYTDSDGNVIAPNASPTDQQLFAAMMEKLGGKSGQGIRRFYTDFSGVTR